MAIKDKLKSTKLFTIIVTMLIISILIFFASVSFIIFDVNVTGKATISVISGIASVFFIIVVCYLASIRHE